MTAAQLVGPQTAGTQRTYLTTETGVPDQTSVNTVVGPVTVNGQTYTETDEVSTTSEFGVTSTQTIKDYQNLTADGFVDNGAVETEQSSFINTTLTYTYAPFGIVIPVGMTAGSPQTFNNTETTVSGGVTGTDTNVVTITLESETPQSVTVPAGTFSAYALDKSLLQTDSNSTQTIVSTEYYAPGVGFIKEVVGSGSGAVTTVLTAFNSVAPGAADHLAFAQQPTSAAVGSAITPAITVDVVDANGNIVSSDASAITLALAPGSGSAALGGTLTTNAQGGVATFSNLSINAPGTFSLTATDSNLTAATSSSFVISSALPSTTTTLAVAAASVTVGDIESFTATVAPVTAGGPTPTGTVSFVSINGVYPSQTVPLDANGVATYSGPADIPGYAAFIAVYSGDSQYASSTSPGASAAVQASTVEPSLIGNSLPKSLVVGGPVKGSETVQLTDTSAAAVSGLHTVNVYAILYNGDDTFTSTLIGTAKKSIKLASGASKPLTVKINSKTFKLTAGTYSIAVTATNPDGKTSYSSTASPNITTGYFTVAEPNVSLTGTVSAASTATVKPGKSINLSLTVTNTGTADANGSAAIAIAISQDKLNGINDSNLNKGLKVRAGKSATVHLHLKIDASTPAGTYFPLITFAEGDQHFVAVGDQSFIVT